MCKLNFNDSNAVEEKRIRMGILQKAELVHLTKTEIYKRFFEQQQQNSLESVSRGLWVKNTGIIIYPMNNK